jgi:hypothetical protein
VTIGFPGRANVCVSDRLRAGRASGQPRRAARPSSPRAGYGWSFPARDEMRIGVGSFDPRFQVMAPQRDPYRLEKYRTEAEWFADRARGAYSNGATP